MIEFLKISKYELKIEKEKGNLLRIVFSDQQRLVYRNSVTYEIPKDKEAESRDGNDKLSIFSPEIPIWWDTFDLDQINNILLYHNLHVMIVNINNYLLKKKI